MGRRTQGGRGGRPEWVRWSGVGFEYAGAVACFSLIGWWLDGRYGWSPWGVLIGLALGLIGGTYNLIRESLMAFKDADRQRLAKEEKRVEESKEQRRTTEQDSDERQR